MSIGQFLHAFLGVARECGVLELEDNHNRCCGKLVGVVLA